MLSLLNPFSWLLRFFDSLIILRSQLPLFLYCYFMKPLRLFLSISLMQAFLLLVWGTIQMRTRAQFSQSFRVFPQSFRDFPTEFSSRCKSGLRTQSRLCLSYLVINVTIQWWFCYCYSVPSPSSLNRRFLFTFLILVMLRHSGIV